MTDTSLLLLPAALALAAALLTSQLVWAAGGDKCPGQWAGFPATFSRMWHLHSQVRICRVAHCCRIPWKIGFCWGRLVQREGGSVELSTISQYSENVPPYWKCSFIGRFKDLCQPNFSSWCLLRIWWKIREVSLPAVRGRQQQAGQQLVASSSSG